MSSVDKRKREAVARAVARAKKRQRAAAMREQVKADVPKPGTLPRFGPYYY